MSDAVPGLIDEFDIQLTTANESITQWAHITPPF